MKQDNLIKEEGVKIDDIQETTNTGNKEKGIKHRLKWYYLYYVIYVLIGIYLKNINFNLSIEVGDFGKLVPAMFFTLAIVSIKWFPYLGVVGFILSTQKERLEDIIALYFIFTLIVMSSTLVIIYLL